MLKKLAGHTDPAGYHAEKKPENKSLETLLKHKLVKKGKKHPNTGHYHYTISKAGQKHLADTGPGLLGSQEQLSSSPTILAFTRPAASSLEVDRPSS